MDIFLKKNAEGTKQSGYSLVELLVVLSLISLISAIALPNFATLYRSFSGKLELDKVVSQINGLGYLANKQGKALTIVGQRSNTENSGQKMLKMQALIDLPDGWVLDVGRPIKYLENGACTGGNLKISNRDVEKLTAVLKPPYCQIRQ